jgi:hypothetical protein
MPRLFATWQYLIALGQFCHYWLDIIWRMITAMSTAMNFLLLAIVLLAPFGMVAALASHAHRGGHLRWHLDQFRFSTPMVGRLVEEDFRRIDHDRDAIRTRFEQTPAWPESGARSERR